MEPFRFHQWIQTEMDQKLDSIENSIIYQTTEAFSYEYIF